MVTAATEREFTPSAGLHVIGSVFDAYKRLFISGRTAPLLSRPNPVRRSGFDMKLTIDHVEVEADDVVSLTLKDPNGAPLPSWLPGAHLDVFLPSGKQRQYSLCGDPADRSSYRIAVRHIRDGGGGSREVHETLRAGNTIHVRGPRNAFQLIDAPSYLFVAGGIGITPILPMVHAAERGGKPWRLVYLGRSLATMPFRDELATRGGGVLDIRPDDRFGMPNIASIVSAAKPGTAVYICGPPPLMEPARALLTAENPTASLHTERFSALPVKDGKPFDVTLQRTGITIPVASDESALSAIRRALPGVKYSCQQGFCGTCKVRVLSGEVEHRDQSLRAADRETSMLTCVSRSVGPLVLDL